MSAGVDRERDAIYAAAPWKTFVEQFREMAYLADSDDAGTRAWNGVVRFAKDFLPDDAGEAVENLTSAHIASRYLSELGR